MTAKRVYIINFRDFYSGESCFRQVFFTKEAAEKYISECKYAHDYEIECFEEREEGASEQIYE